MIRRYVKSMMRQTLNGDGAASESGIAAICGGNAEALGDLFGKPNKAGTSVVSVSTLSKNIDSIIDLSTEERMETFGFRKDRAEVIGIAALVFATIAKQLEIKELHVPHVGLREGVLLEFSNSHRSKSNKKNEAQSYWSARTFAERLGHNLAHGEHVRHFATLIFRELKELHELPDEYEEILGLSALLHDVGEVVHRKSHHKHSEYLIQHGRMPGLSERDRLMAAAVARAHRGNEPDER